VVVAPGALPEVVVVPAVVDVVVVGVVLVGVDAVVVEVVVADVVGGVVVVAVVVPGAWTTIVPVMNGCRSQWNVYVPAELKLHVPLHPGALAW
jgi:hypothetical protein